MSNINTNATVTLQVNGQQAERTLNQLKSNALDLETAIARAAASGNKLDLKKLRKELSDTKRQIREIETSSMQVEDVMRRMDKATPKELERTLKILYQQLEMIERGSEGWDKHVNKIQLVEREIDAVKKQMKTTHDVMQQTLGNMGAASVTQLETALKMLQADLKQLIPGSKAWEAQKLEIDRVKVALDRAGQAAGVNGVAIKRALLNLDTASIHELEQALAGLQQKLKGMNRNDPAWGQTKRDIDAVSTALNEARAAATQMHDVMKLNMNDINRLTPRELTAAMDQLKAKMENVSPNTKEWERMRMMMERLKVAAATSGETIAKTMRHLDTASPERLKTTLDMLQKQLQHMKVGSSVWDAQTQKINKVKAALDRAKVAMTVNGQEVQRVLRNLSQASPKELERTLHALNLQLEELRRGSAAWNSHVEKIKRVKLEMAKLKQETSNQLSLWERFNMKLNDWQMSIVGFIATFSGLMYAGRRAVNSYAEMEEEMANTRKYTNMTEEQVERLNDTFKKMDTRLGRDKLNELAQEAGRLGKNTMESVQGYVEAASIINVALVDLGEGATQTIAKIANIFGIEQMMGTKQAMLSVGSAVNTVSQNCTASKQYLVEFAQRMAGVGAQANLTIPQIIALGATLDANGQKVEMSSSAISRLIMKIYQDMGGIAKSVGLNVNYFSKVMKDDAYKGMLMFLEQIHKMGAKDGMAALGPLFKDLGMDGIRMAQVLATLADHLDMVKWETGEANKAFNQATSATREYEIFNNTAQAKIEKAKIRIHELAVELGEKLVPVYSHIMTSSTAFLRVLNVLVSFIGNYYRELASLTAAFVAYKVAVNASTIAFKAHYAWVVLTETATKALRASQLLAAAAWALCTGNIAKATAAMRLFNTVTKANPWGLLISGLIMAGTAIYNLVQRHKEAAAAAERQAEMEKRLDNSVSAATQRIGEETGAVTRLRDAILKANAGTKERTRLINEWNSRYGRYIKQLLNEKSTAEDLAEAYAKVCQQIRTKALLEAKEKDMKENVDNRMGWLATRLAEYEAINNKKRGGESAINSEWLKEKIEELYAKGYDKNKLLHDLHQAMNGSILARMGKTVKERLDNSQWGEDMFKAADAAALQYMSMKTKEREVNRKWAPFAKDMLMAEEEVEHDYGGGSFYGGDTGGSGGHGGSGSEHEERFAEEKAWLAQEQALARIAYAKGVTNYDEYQRTLADLQLTYEQKILSREDLAYAERLEHQAAYYDARDKKNKVYTERDIEEEERRYDGVMATLKQHYVDGLLSNEQYSVAEELEELKHLKKVKEIREQLAKLPLQRYEKNKAYAEKEGKDFTQERPEIEKTPEYAEFIKADEAYQNKLVENQKKRIAAYEEAEKKHQERLKKMKEEYFGDNPQERMAKYKDDLAILTEVYNAELTAAGHNAKERLRIEKAFQKAKLALMKKYNIEGANENQNFLQNWNDGITEFLESDAGKAIAGAVDVLSSSMSAMFQQLTTIVEAELDIQTAEIEKRYEREISLAEGNNYKVKKLEKQKEAEIAKAKNEANKKMFAMQVMQAIAQTASSAISAYSSAAAVPVIGYILAPIAAASAVAAGMLQVAAIKKQQQASEAQGYSAGGFTPEGRVDEAVGVVHAGEWVASQKLLRNPKTRPLIEALDYVQRTNTVGTLDPGDVSRTITAPVRLASYTDNVQSTPQKVIIENQSEPVSAAALSEYAETMRRLQARLDEPFVTMNTVTGDFGSKKAQDDYDRLIRNKTPKSRR